MPRNVKQGDQYLNTLLKLIPSEIVVAYTTILNFLVADNTDKEIYWVVGIIAIIATPVWLLLYTDILKEGLQMIEVRQLFVSTIAAGLWVFMLGGPHIEEFFMENEKYAPAFRATFLLIFTVIIAPYATQLKNMPKPSFKPTLPKLKS